MSPRQSPSNRTNVFILLFLCLVSISCGEKKEALVERLDAQGIRYYAENQFAKALHAWNQILPMRPDAPEIYRKIGDAWAMLGSYDSAVIAYQNSLRLRRDEQSLWLKMARLQLTLQDYNAVEESWRTIQTFSITPEILIFQGDFLVAQKKYQEARESYQKAIAFDHANQTALSRLAVCLLGLRETTQAEEVYATLESLQPQSPDTLLQMSNYWGLKGDLVQAESLLSQAIAFDQQRMDIRFKLAELYIGTGDHPKAIAVLKDLLQLHPDNHLGKKLLIETLLQDNQLEEAQRLLEHLSALEMKDLQLLLVKGKYFLNNHEFRKAISLFQMVVNEKPKMPLASYFLALSFLAAGENNLGQKALINCLVLHPNFTEAELALADSYYKSHNYDSAMEHAKRIAEREPENFRAHLILAHIFSARQNYSSAMREYKAALLLHPEFATPLYYMAMTASALGQIEESLQLYGALLRKHPELVDATFHYARSLALGGKHENAVQYLKNAIINGQDNPYLHYILGQIHLDSGNRQDAISSFRQAIEKNPEMKAPYLKLFDLLPTEDLVDFLNTASSKIHPFPEARMKLANIYRHNGQPAQAIAILEEALAATPEAPQLANNLALLYLEYQPDNLDEAMRLAQLAHELLPKNPAISDTLGWIYLKKKMLTRAVWLFEQAKELAPQNPQIDLHLRMARENQLLEEKNLVQ